MRRAAPLVVAVVGLMLVVAGAILLVTADLQVHGATGWFAYGEDGMERAMAEAERSFSITGPDSAALGALLLVVGLLVESALGGWLLGRRPGR